jgi:hypothetical protein
MGSVRRELCRSHKRKRKKDDGFAVKQGDTREDVPFRASIALLGVLLVAAGCRRGES